MAGVPLAGTDWIPKTWPAQGGQPMATDLAAVAKKDGIKYFLISFVDLFGVLRAKLVRPRRSATCRRPAPALPASPPARHDAGRSGHVRDPDPNSLTRRGGD